jgi:hypothetical protein
VTVSLFILGSLLLPAQQSESTETPPPIKITEGWSYRIGDSPLDQDGIPLWTYQDLDSPEWRPTSSTSHFPMSKGENMLWFRVPLPEETRNNPTLFLPRVYLNEVVASFMNKTNERQFRWKKHRVGVLRN